MARLQQSEPETQEYASATMNALTPSAVTANEGLPSEDELKSIQALLLSSDDLEKQAGRVRLLSLGDAGIGAYFAFEHAARKRKLKILLGGSIGAAVTIILVSFMVRVPSFIITFSGFGAVVAGAAAYSRSYRAAILALAQVQNLDALSELITILQANDTELQNAVIHSLTERFELLTEQDYNRITPEARNALNNWLLGRYRYRITDAGAADRLDLALLRALPVIGDSRFLPTVEAIANGVGMGSLDMRIEAARECLPKLQELAARQQSGSELLRASERDTSEDSRDLVRPAGQAGLEQSSDELLRPGR